MTKIRLARIGSTHQPYYRIVVADSRNRRDGRFIEILGSYNPHTNPSTIQVNKERADYWVATGAQASNTVISLLTRANVTHSFVVRKKPVKPVEVPVSDTAKPAEAPATEVATPEAA